MTSIHRIPTGHVELGMFVSEQTPNLEQSGLNSRGLISRKETLAKLKASGIAEIYIDTNRGKASSYSEPVQSANVAQKPELSLAEEWQRADKVYGEARSLVGNIVKDVKMGKAIEVGPVEELADEMCNSVLANANALLCLSQIREKDQYLLEHSINVGILMGVFCRYLGYEREQLHQAVTGAILHDVGKIRVPYHILNKEGKLTDDEWVEMRNHVLYGEEVLLKSEGISDIALSICAQHHEKVAGGGYPRGIDHAQITTYGKLASIVDIYDAITAERCYKKGKSPFETMRILSSLAGDSLDKALVYQFIRCMSVYPVGTLVQLSNGRLGVVVQPHDRQPDRPQVKTFFNLKLRQYEADRIVDLSNLELGIKIVKAHDAEALKIKVRDYISL
ncbi:HD-GYP domain-containing protein [Agaribacterium haliotis]|uniref:HD-GYP domain-containing protein n=1 Tax=Agaribacterium haliotis TaxID=2013869 RepID=UPI000BB55408|nr:HD-GYP domain-containing protein [Agaribacterium haliotis]